MYTGCSGLRRFMNKLLEAYLIHTDWLDGQEVVGYYSEIIGGDLVYNVKVSSGVGFSKQTILTIPNDDLLSYLFERTLHKEI